MNRFILMLILLVSTSCFAGEVAGLYQAQLPVSSQSAQERKQIAPQILTKVLAKVVGDSKALDSIDLTGLLANTERLIDRYQYHRINEISDDLTQPDQLELQLDFNQTTLNQALTDLALPIWGKSRPELLLWIAIDNNGSRSIIGADNSENKLVKLIQQAITARGVPFLLPLMDLQDQAQLTVADLWAGFPQPVLAASQRYAPQVVVMARVTIASDQLIQIRWQSLIDGQEQQWQSQGNIDQAIQDGTTQLVDSLAQRFMVVAANQAKQNYDLYINNITSYADYVWIREYLMALTMVSDLQLLSLNAQQVKINIALGSDLSVLKQTIALDQVLTEDANASDDGAHYQLIP